MSKKDKGNIREHIVAPLSLGTLKEIGASPAEDRHRYLASIPRIAQKKIDTFQERHFF